MIEKHLSRLAQEKVEGQLILSKAIAGVQEEKEKIENAKRRGRDNNMQMKKANDDLKALQGVWKVEDDTRDEKRKAEQLLKDHMSEMRKQTEANQKRRKQEEQQKMIDKAVENLRSLKNTEDTRLQTQISEKLAADNAREDLKMKKREQSMQSIKRSREAQIALKNRLKEEKMKQEKDFSDQWVVRQKMIEDEEKADVLNKQKDNKEYEKYLKRQIIQIRKEKQKEKEEKLRLIVEKGNTIKFENHVREVIDMYAAEGKNIIPIARSLIPGKMCC